ncbi:protein kinase domain-containing protein [Lishizhenia sp.]|uniref:protein kinase domain-containing protein n=1 Tax=Lishizhenia sp. TaxID=2497594 RepID=UPI00299ECBF6|nr:protein kinase [Lishizhenia sp.]MDX1446481.1 protein kinase [Lishizhenia sp.]
MNGGTPQGKRKFSSTRLVQEISSGEYFILKSTPLIDRKAVETLRNEGKYQFESPNLQSSLKYWIENNQYYLLKEYIKGVGLITFYKALKRKEKRKFIPRFLTGVSKLLDELHVQKIVHLDLKPTNIIIEGSVNDFSVKLIDFGMAWDLKTDVFDKRKSSYPFGHAAPELILNEPALFVPQTDYYALGILLYEMMEGEIPFLHSNPIQSLNLQLNMALPALSRKWKAYQTILNKLTAKQAFHRPPNQLPRLEQKRVLEQGIELRYENLKMMRRDLENIYPVPEF